MSAFPRPLSKLRAAGFSLVEIMVGMVIGMLGIIIMMQVFTLAESQKRTTTGGGDAQSNAAISLYGLQRDIRQAGFGASDMKLLGCTVTLRTAPATVNLNGLAPVTINHASIPAGDANSDTLLIAYASTNGSPQGDGIVSQPASAGAAAAPDIYAVQTPTSFTNGDRVIATPQNRATPCNLSLATVACVGTACPGVTSPNYVLVGSGTGVAGSSNGALFNLGQNPKVLAYAVRNGNLTQCDYIVNDCSIAANTGNTAIWVPIASNVVAIKALYGRDTSATMDDVVDTFDETAPLTACDWARVSALRIALVARNANFEKTAVTTVAPTWEGSATNPIDLSANASWQNYRYRVVQTLVPLRNLAWQGAQPGC